MRLKSAVAITGLVLAVLGGTARPGVADDPNTAVLANTAWPMYGHDSKRTFRSPYLGPTSNNELPPTNMGNLIRSQVIVGLSSSVFMVAAGRSVWGIRPDGLRTWSMPTFGELLRSTPAVDTNGFFYIGGRDNRLWKGASSVGVEGDVICSKYLPYDSDIRSSPTISVTFPNRVYVETANQFFAIGIAGSAGQCVPLWRIPLAGFTQSSVALEDSSPGAGDSRGHLVTAASNVVYRITDNDSTGEVYDTRELLRMTDGSSPMIHPVTGNIYIGDRGGFFYGLKPDLNMPDLFPPVKLRGRILGAAALSPDGNTLYVATTSGELHALDALTGVERPGFPFISPLRNRYKARGYAPAVDAGNNIFVGGTDRLVRSIKGYPSSSPGAVNWEKHISGLAYPMTIVDGGLLVASSDHQVHRFCPEPEAVPNQPPNIMKICGSITDTTLP